MLTKAKITNLPKRPKGLVKFNVTLAIDRNGIFSLTATSADGEVAASLIL